ncbi:LacI family DNA-binding transcriptional regulator [Victivallis vadensis]|uniref:LacI family DNA-binding transcriptional regulator n=1 Tax=Victivallis vadensis TaxID=172901 RepID=UPI0026DB5E4D|nr:LacI family DNA-binding transcriptional regulator [Victivallis vadensis]
MAVTLKDISKLSGVATSTVSYILAGKGNEMKISMETQERVRRIAQVHHYRANLLAKSLRRRTTRTIGVVMNDLSSSWANEIMIGVNDVLLPAGYQPLLGITMFGQKREEKLINAFLELQVEGVLVQPVATSGDFYRRLPGMTETPVIFIGDALEGVEVKSFMLDPEWAGREQINLLYRHGHRRIACVTVDYESVQSRGRREGALKRIAELNLDMPKEYLCVTRVMSPEADHGIARQLLALPKPPTAIAVFCDIIAFQILGALREAGRPDIAVIGCGDLPESSSELISLSTIGEPREDIGRQAAAYLLKCVSGLSLSDLRPTLLHGKVQERKSTNWKGVFQCCDG